MEFEIPENMALELLDRLEKGSPLEQKMSEQGICHGSMVVPSRLFDGYALNVLYGLAKVDGPRSLLFQLLAFDNIRNAPQARKIPSLEKVINGMISYIQRDSIDGWLYRRNKDGVLLPWLVHGMRHVIPPQGRDYVIISLLANTMNAASKEASDDYRMRRAGMTTTIVVDGNDIANKTIPELLANYGYYKECKEFKEEYERHTDHFMRLQKQFGEQFTIGGSMFVPDGNGNQEYVRLQQGLVARAVNDEEILERRFENSADGSFWEQSGGEKIFDRVPTHSYMYLFHLELHKNIWVHVQNVKEYQYKPELREKLILPQSHSDLIDILTSDMDVLMEDIVEGKSGGTTILCMGAPGLGKTLTAEVYSEVVKKPLYRVHSGQLGITAESVEANLSTILRRASRWDAILLLDEADVYIRQRDNDLQHNAIVAEFLRTLEYFNGLLFMTTNRNDDVDDAILSRCIAIIRYEVPPEEAARRLWTTLGKQLGADLSPELIESLIFSYPQASGRDIKELLKLTIKYCKGRDIPLSEETFQQCAVFRGII